VPGTLQAITFKDERTWVKASTLPDAFQAMERFKAAGLEYRIVAGNTGTGKLVL